MKKTAFLRTAFLALAFCMAFVLIPNSNASVSASEMPSGHTCDGVTYDIPLDSSFTGGTLASGNYYLTEGITLAKKIEINAGSDVKICLNGKSINTEDVTGFDYTIRNYGTLTLNNCDTANGIINTYSFTFLCYNNSVLYGNAAIYSPMEVKGRSKISGCTFNNDISCTANSEITGGTFLNRTYIHNSVVISGGTFNQEVKVFDSGVITGGYFSKAISSYNGNFIKGGYFKTKPDDSYIADGYVITDSGDTNYPYRVVMPHTCNGVTYDKPLDSSFTGGTLASGNYYLTEDITLASIIQINAGSDVKICLNGKSISGHYVENYGALTLNNCNAANGKLNNYYFGYGNSELYGNAVISSTNISLIEGNSRISGCVFDNYIRLLDNTLITGGTFNQRVETFDSSVIAGGYFSKAISAYNEKFIRGGYFKTKPDDSYIDDGYVITDSGDTNYPYRVVMPHTCNGVTYDKPLDSSFTGGTLASGNYYLTEDIDLTDTIKIAAGSDVKICLNGKNISGYNVENRGTLTLNNCNAANGKLNNYYHGYNDSVLYGNAVINTTVFSSTEGTSKISGCIFDHKFVCAENSEITGGTFNQMVAVHDHGVITGGYFGGTVANGTVGKFIKGGYFKTKPDDSYIADGYAITASGNSNYPYKVVLAHICDGVTYDKPLDSSFKGGTLASGNYYLTEDINLTNTIEISAGSDVKICLNGKSISEYYVNNYGTLTLNNCNAANGKVNTYYNGYNNSVLYGNAVINNTVFSSTEGTSKISGCIFDHKFVCMENSEITGGTFNQTVAVYDHGVITGGYFGGTVASGTVDDKFIKGGYFKTKPNDNFIADGYIITASGNTNYPYKVVLAHICDGITYDKPLDSSSSGKTLTSGNYYLTEDITLTDDIKISAGSDVKICLNGKNCALSNYVINYGTLTLNNCHAKNGKLNLSRYYHGFSNSVLYGNAVINSSYASNISYNGKVSGCVFDNEVRCTANSMITGGTFNQKVVFDGNSTVTGGYFGGTVEGINNHTKFIKGGYFKTKPDDSLIADGYAITASGNTNYPYKVAVAHICNGVTYSNRLDSTFTGGTLASGNYYLTENLTLTSEIRVDRNSTVKICLNGHSITQTANAGIFANNGSLDIIDCMAAGKLSGGKGCTSTQAGGCIYNSGTITISGITMDGNSAPHGGAVSNYGDMQITNCTITNNSANGDGGGISNSGTLTVTNTKITGNNAVNGGGISTIGKLTLNNVTVTGNTADHGSGIRTNASPDVTVSGDIIIRDNSAGKYPDMLLNSSKLAVDANGPGANSYISVSAIPAPTSTAPVSLTGTNNADYSGYFHTDNPDYAIINGENNTVMLVMGEYTVTFDANGHGTAPTQQKTTYGGKITEPAAPTAENYYFQGWFKESTCENMWDFDSDTVTADITLYAKWSECDHSGNTNTLSCTNNTTCSVCGGTVAPTGHTPSASRSNDSTDHWRICENPWCGEIIEKSAHTYGGWTVTIPATEEHEGERQHTCTECGYTETEIISKEAHVHSFGSEWKHDGTYHWHECDCGERTDVSAHTPDGGRTAQSGGIYTGTLTYTCTVCGSVTGTERIKDNKTYDIPDYTFAPLYIETGITYEKLRIGVETDESSVTLSWNSIGGAKGYKVYVYDSDDALISVKKTDETTITFKKLTNGETYRFVVKYTLSGRSYLSNYSDEAKVTIMYKPFVKVSAGFGSVKLSWEAVEGAEKYAVYKINDGRAVKLTETTKLSVRISTSEEGIYGVKAYVNGKWTTLTTSDLVKAKAE
ncbi:InlB B-repeat-containing protein [Huintestinicola sp.]|uniref:InlB B-repeat-containing protein n=1 Tax=Huintestinicola sp. TaxID=2981661 RepID=UPI00307B50C5